jgi:hypothetical protein
VLVATFLAYRPLSLDELAVLAGLLPEMTRTIVEKCGSFLTVTGETVYLIHQSAKDYLKANFELRLQKDGVLQGHRTIVSRSLDVMSTTLQRDVYDLQHPGFSITEVKAPDPDPLASIRYSCVSWVDHLCEIESSHDGVGVFRADHFCFPNGESPECKVELMDDGPVFGFLKERFLRWLESLSLLGKLSDGVHSIRRLLHIAQVCYDGCGYMQILSIASHNRIRVLGLLNS